jgi:hypothetical protein
MIVARTCWNTRGPLTTTLLLEAARPWLNTSLALSVYFAVPRFRLTVMFVVVRGDALLGGA